MSIRFTKMHGLGNDFMVINAINQTIHLTPKEIAQLSRRDTGIGFDQCLLIEKSQDPEIDFFYRIFNANGQEVGQCGNGARCLARFVSYYELTKKNTIKIATSTIQMILHINSDQSVTVEMEPPLLDPNLIPIQAKEQASLYTLPLAHNSTCQVHALNVGNPHAVMQVSDVQQIPVLELGAQISKHPYFPEQTNVDFMQILNKEEIKLRVYERGCGETQACGSGAVAAAAVGQLFHQVSSQVKVHLPGGNLFVHWPDQNHSIFLTGPATFVYEGSLCGS